MTQQVKFINKNKFVETALSKNIKAFKIYISSLVVKIRIYLVRKFRYSHYWLKKSLTQQNI